MEKHTRFLLDLVFQQSSFGSRRGENALVCSLNSHLVCVFGCSQSLLEMGTADLDFVQLSQLIGRKTGGISVYPSTSSVRGRTEPSSHIFIKGKAMASQTADLFDLVSALPRLVSQALHF